METLTCGIDFGTSNSLAGLMSAEGVRLCNVDPVNHDPQLLPSVLYFSRYGWNRAGRAATHAYQKDPDGRFIRALKSALPEYDDEFFVRIFGDRFTLPDLAALLLTHIRERVEETAGAPVRHAVVGRPVRFSPDPEIDLRTENLIRAGAARAGFEDVRFMTEPEAATRFYFAQEGRAGETRDATVLVFDFGGGTLDLCLARFGSQGYEVLNTAGAHIGGTLLDRILFEKKLLPHLGYGKKWDRGLELPGYIFHRLVNPDANWRISDVEYAREVKTILNASIAGGTVSRQLKQFFEVASRRLGPDLFTAIEEAKIRLSDTEETEIRFEADGVKIAEPLTRSDLRVLFAEELDAIRNLIAGVLSGPGLKHRDVDRVLLAGGSSALICTQELLRELFGDDRVPVRQDLFTSIVSGLTLSAGETVH